MSCLPNPAVPARPAKATLLVLAIVATLSGCAQLPEYRQSVRMKPVSEYQATASLTASDGAWPAENWWAAYGDAQLDAMIGEALRDSPDLAAASARLRRAEAFGQVAGSLLWPQIGANASASEQKLSYNHLVPRTPATEGWNDYGQATLNLYWELDFWGRNRAALAAATSHIEAGRAELAHVRLSLAAAVAMNYADLARLFAVRDTVVRSVAVRSKTAALFNERFLNGLETRGSMNEAKSRLAAAEGELLSIDEQIGLQRNRLAALLGAGPDRGLTIIRPAINLRGHYSLPSELAANLLGRRPDVQAARLIAEAQAYRIDQKKAEFYPNVNLSAFIGVQSLGLDMLSRSGSDIGSVGPAVSLPIFTAGRLQGELRGAVAGYDEAVASYNRAVTQALQEVASAGLSQKALASQLVKGREAVDAAGEAHRVASDRYRGGLASYLEVLYAEDGLLVSQRQLANLQSRAFSLDIALKRALGGGFGNNKI